MGFVEIEKENKRYQAEYHAHESAVTVFGERGREFTQLGGMSENQIAKILLRSLIRKGQIKPLEGDADSYQH